MNTRQTTQLGQAAHKEGSANLLEHYRQFSLFTNPGPYGQNLVQSLPDDVRAMGELVRRQTIHRVTLAKGNIGSNADLRYGDMTKIPWWRQPEDDNLPTAVSMLAELYRRDQRGFSPDRAERDKLIVTCRFVAILTAAILKSKGMSARVRSGFDPYAPPKPGMSCDHWINQYWESKQQRWITIDVDNCFEEIQFDPFDVPLEEFDWAASVWLKAREGKVDPARFWNACGVEGLMPISWALVDDFHCLMNNEIIYMHIPRNLAPGEFNDLTYLSLEKLDQLAQLMLEPDKNFDALCRIWQTERDFRLLSGALL